MKVLLSLISIFTLIRISTQSSLFNTFIEQKDTHGFQKLLTILNQNDFCLLPGASVLSQAYFQAFNRNNGVNLDELRLVTDENYLLTRTYKKRDEIVVPFITHRVWVTSYSYPREVLNVLVDPYLQNQILVNNKILEESSQNKWTHYFWVNDKSLVPETVKHFESHGFVFREFKELQTWDELSETIMHDYLFQNKPGAVSDYARQLIVNEVGGFYLDLDIEIGCWDERVHKWFDFLGFGFPYPEFEQDILFNPAIFARPNSDYVTAFLQKYRENYMQNKKGNKPFHLRSCTGMVVNAIHYDTGQYLCSLVFWEEWKQNKTDDSMIITTPGDKQIKFDDGTTQTFRIDLRNVGQGSWADDYLDNLNFGWIELNQ